MTPARSRAPARAASNDVAPRGCCTGDISWNEAEILLNAGLRPVLAVGAAAKEHGHHLPLDTDLRTARWLGQAIAARWPALVWPPVGYGPYPAFLDYPGSISIGAGAFAETLHAFLDTIAMHTRRTAVIVNTGISTIATIDAVAAARTPAPRVAHVFRGEHYRVAASTCTQTHGGHGDEAETSILLAIAPDAVRLERAEAFDAALPPGRLSRRPGARGFTPQGVWGRPDRASAALGRRLLAAMLNDLQPLFGTSA